VAQRRHHYEQAFEHYLRARRIPYVAVNEAKKALLPDGAALRVADDQGEHAALKSFDFVIYGDGTNLLVEVKGRKIPWRKSGVGRLESWVTEDDIAALGAWEDLFGAEFQAAFVFVYWCESAPPMALFEEMFELRSRFYALRAVTLTDYVSSMKPRSPRWRTVDLPTDAFNEIARPLIAGTPAPTR
jgi:hypothetical protein